MKDLLEKIGSTVSDFRNGDRVVIGGKLSLDSSVYRKSREDEPYFRYGYDTDFSINLIEVILIAAGIIVSVILLFTLLKKKINKIFRNIKKKS